MKWIAIIGCVSIVALGAACERRSPSSSTHKLKGPAARPVDTPSPEGVAASKDLTSHSDLLVGRWKIVGGYTTASPDPNPIHDYWLIQDNKITWEGRLPFTGTWRVDSNTSPPQIEVTLHAPNGKASTMRGIFELQEDRLRVAFPLYGESMPTEFPDRFDDATRRMVVLERARIAAPTKATEP